MSIVPGCDEDLVRRLPLPLAQLYRRAYNAKTPLERHLTAYYLWEAALKLLASAAVVTYADLGTHDPKVAEPQQALHRRLPARGDGRPGGGAQNRPARRAVRPPGALPQPRAGPRRQGVVFRAWQPSLGRQVALKCLLRLGDPKAEARFGREIQALGKVDHPHLVKVFTSGSDGDR